MAYKTDGTLSTGRVSPTDQSIEIDDWNQVDLDGFVEDEGVLRLPTAVPKDGLLHDLDARALAYSDGETADPFIDQESSNDMSAIGSPEFSTDGINGNESVVYNGSDTVHQGDRMPLGDNDEYTFAVVVEPNSVTGTHQIFQPEIEENGTSMRSTYLRIEDGNYELIHATYDQIVTDATSNELAILVGAYDGSTAYLDLNGSTKGSESMGIESDTSREASTIGGRGEPDRVSDAQVGRVLWYTEFYDSDGRKEIYEALTGQFGGDSGN